MSKRRVFEAINPKFARVQIERVFSCLCGGVLFGCRRLLLRLRLRLRLL